MIKNNKGVTLIELLIVIVVMGIIAAFAIPAVGTIITNTNKDAVKADAIAVENGAKLYCAQTVCEATQSLTLTQIAPYVEGITIDATGGYDGTLSTAVKSTAGWTVTLEGYTTAAPFVYEWTAAIPSAATDRSNVVMDAN